MKKIKISCFFNFNNYLYSFNKMSDDTLTRTDSCNSIETTIGLIIEQPEDISFVVDQYPTNDKVVELLSIVVE